MTVAYFADLDGTTIFSRSWDVDRIASVPVEFHHGTPMAWMALDAAARLRDFRAVAELVPTTTRVQRQFDRVRLPGGPPEVAIVANGMHILWEGERDAAWAERMRDPSWGVSHLEAVMVRLKRLVTNAVWVKDLRGEDGIVVIVCFPHTRIPEDIAVRVAAIAAEHGYGLWQQGRKTYLIPRHVSKERAAAEVAARIGATVTLAAGDTTLDHGLLTWAEHAIQPRHATPAAGIPVTASSGVAAGFEILDWAVQVARDATGRETMPRTDRP